VLGPRCPSKREVPRALGPETWARGKRREEQIKEEEREKRREQGAGSRREGRGAGEAGEEEEQKDDERDVERDREGPDTTGTAGIVVSVVPCWTIKGLRTRAAAGTTLSQPGLATALSSIDISCHISPTQLLER